MLDECCPEIEICGYTYSASIALYRIDEVAYDCGFNDYVDSRREDIVYDLERMGDGDTDHWYGCNVEAVDDGDEEDDDE